MTTSMTSTSKPAKPAWKGRRLMPPQIRPGWVITFHLPDRVSPLWLGRGGLVARKSQAKVFPNWSSAFKHLYRLTMTEGVNVSLVSHAVIEHI